MKIKMQGLELEVHNWREYDQQPIAGLAPEAQAALKQETIRSGGTVLKQGQVSFEFPGPISAGSKFTTNSGQYIVLNVTGSFVLARLDK